MRSDFVQLRSFTNYVEANIVLGMLQDAHINCHLKDENIITIDPLLSPALGGMKLMVHHSQAERAWEMMQQAERNYLQTVACPICHQHKLEAIMVSKPHKCRLGALASMLLKGTSVEEVKMYRCRNCGYDFKELS